MTARSSSDQAIRDLQQRLQAEPGLAHLHAELALACESAGQWADASEEWERYLQRDPTGPLAARAWSQLRQLAARREAAAREWLPLLTDPQPTVRCKAVTALTELRHSHTVRPLLAALEDEDELVREKAGYALRLIGEPALKPVLLALTSDEGDLRAWAARVLGPIGGPRAAEALVGALRDPLETVRVQAARALHRIGAAAVPLLRRLLSDSDPTQRRMVAQLLGQIADPDALEALIDALHDADPVVRREAVDRLAQKAEVRAAEALLQGRLDSDEQVRARTEAALERLVYVLSTELYSLASGRRAAQVLTEIGTSEALAAVRAWESSERTG